jgi:hypothetical protein
MFERKFHWGPGLSGDRVRQAASAWVFLAVVAVGALLGSVL